MIGETSEAFGRTIELFLFNGTFNEYLVKQGILVPGSEDKQVFVRPYSFNSPFCAAAVVLDRNSNGRTERKVKGQKRNYHDWQQARITSDEVEA